MPCIDSDRRVETNAGRVGREDDTACLPAQVYDGGERSSDVVGGGTLVEALVERRRPEDSQCAVRDEQVAAGRRRRHVQMTSVLQPLVPVHNIHHAT